MTRLEKTTNNHQLTTTSEECLHQLGALARKHAAANFQVMIQLRVVEHLYHRMNRTRFGIVRAVHQTLQPRVHHGARAHRARLNCNKQLTAPQTMVTDVSPGFPQSEDLSMGRGIGVGDISVPAPAYDLAVSYHDRAHGYLTCFEGLPCSA